MTVDAQAIKAHCSPADADRVEAMLRRVDDEYLHRFDAATVASHFQQLLQLNKDEPVRTLVEQDEEGHVVCTVLAFDHPFEFSLLTGVLAGTGLSIVSGDVFTLPVVKGETKPTGTTRRRQIGGRRWTLPTGSDPNRRGLIVDHFVGRLVDEGDTFDAWRERFESTVRDAIMLLETGEEGRIEQAKKRVNEMVTQRLLELNTPPEKLLLPVDLDLTPLADKQTRIAIVGEDTPAFLYTLSTALSLRGFDIRRVRIRNAAGGYIRDEIDLADPATHEPLPEETLRRVKLSVVLTKQFSYFLGQAPDPFTALQRFGQLISELLEQPSEGEPTVVEGWLDLLADPRALHSLARLLGMSDYLWEDFIRGQYESVLSVIGLHLQGKRFCEPMETLPLRLAETLDGAMGLAEQQDRLNRFKSRETFLIDLDHILTPGVDFRDLSAHLTTLAENLIDAATRLVFEDLVRSFGRPCFEKVQTEFVDGKTFGQTWPYAVFGLGKLGGVALGYASDLELLFVYPGMGDAGQTAGGKREPISNTEFYETLVRDTTQFLKTKREGIFEIDLRLRPYGNDGPLAVSLDQFRRYYDPATTGTGTQRKVGNGAKASSPPHAFERLALVRLRWIAGDPELGYEVEKLRDRFVYERPELDMDALWTLWGKQKKQKLAGNKHVNAKYSPGALVDLEGAVQLLQVQHARRVPQLRTARVSQAMDALRRAEVLPPRDYAELSAAYYFYRQLINALRILRGDARDLFLPEVGSDDLTHLARRMGYAPLSGRRQRALDLTLGDRLHRDFAHHREVVGRFLRSHFDRPMPYNAGHARDPQ
ncbi:hypothetical protein ACERK3_17655 [Phycisphaerales bacterium AB-hyl4]|uniref:ACT domain-containing protein n=1 Tax=Natronomicrosphaera hydrolytica TaxID=3242702 RepID=A0ABV4U921_9BACT